MTDRTTEFLAATANVAGTDANPEIEAWIVKQEKEIAVLAKNLNEHLETRTFIVGNTLTKADLWSFAKVHEQFSTTTEDGRLKRANLTRWFDLIQELSGTQTVFARVDISLEAPELVIQKVVKEKEDTSAADKKAKKAQKKDDGKKGKGVATEETSAPASPAPAATEAATPKKEKKEKALKAPKAAPAPAGPATPQPWQIDLRVGKILDVQKHPDADSLYVETIDVGEAEPRTVVSGLVKHIPIEEMAGRWLICVCNLKPATMRGVKSFAMVLAATDDTGKLELVEPPKGAKPGDKCYFGNWKEEKPEEVMNPKKKIWETIQPGLLTTPELRAAWKSDEGVVHVLKTAAGDCTVPSVVNAHIK